MDQVTRKQKKPTIADEQIKLMCSRYVATIDAHFTVMGATHGDRELDKARDASQAAIELIGQARGADARHLVGLVQGILLCKGILSWEYLASDDTRK